MSRKQLAFLVFLLFFNLNISFPLAQLKSSAVIENGRTVVLEYTLKVNGQIVESIVGKPIAYIQGKDKNLLPALTRQLNGLHIGDKKTVLVPVDEAYGSLDTEAFKEVPISALPKGVEPTAGKFFEIQIPDGSGTIPAIIWEVHEDTETVVLNFNHPLAGQDLQFDVKVLDIR